MATTAATSTTTTTKAPSKRKATTTRATKGAAAKAAKPKTAKPKAAKPEAAAEAGAAKTAIQSPDWYALLEAAIQEPGQVLEAYRYFHKYSLANRWLASTQLRALGLPLTPINTFKGWLDAKRPVVKGQTCGIALIMPVPLRSKKKDASGEEVDATFTTFMLRKHWFHLGQTAGEEYVPETPKDAEWSLTAAQAFLKIEEVPFVFSDVSDLRQSYAQGRPLAVSTLAQHPLFQRIREMARIQLGHNDETPGKNVPTDVHLREIEAEAAAYLCAASLGIEGIELGRQVLQDNLAGLEVRRIPAQCAKRAFSAADQLINAGYC